MSTTATDPSQQEHQRQTQELLAEIKAHPDGADLLLTAFYTAATHYRRGTSEPWRLPCPLPHLAYSASLHSLGPGLALPGALGLILLLLLHVIQHKRNAQARQPCPKTYPSRA